jgi:catechol 2,3-dioxygenase-like lactoylglutathione lyase family enzyme
MATSTKFNVGGVLLDQPFRIRRLGHFGFNVNKMDECLRFYRDLLGFRSSDESQMGTFLRYGSDHHAMVLFDKPMIDERARQGRMGHHFREENDINQITWQVQSLQEIWDATAYFRNLELDIRTEGRGGIGSNYHLYVFDPDEQIDELYYGIEQIGWNGQAKPPEMRHGMPEATHEPHIAEWQEVDEDVAKGIDIASGHRHVETMPFDYAVDGIYMPRPFKITRIGPVNLFADDVNVTTEYYRDVLGFTVTEDAEWQGEKAVFLRCNTEHHCLGIFPKSWRSKLGLSPHTSNMSFGLQLANYRQLKDAVAFLRENGVRVETDIIPPELHPGIDYAAYAFDPEGHCLELYCYMEQLGWDGRPRPKAERRRVDPNNWPETLEPQSDEYSGESFMGPWA